MLLTMFQCARAFTGSCLKKGRLAVVSRGELDPSSLGLCSMRPETFPRTIRPTNNNVPNYYSKSKTIHAFSSVNLITKLYMTSYIQPNSNSDTLIGIDWVKEIVLKVLNDTFDAKEVARSAALAKLEPKQKKKKSSDASHDTEGKLELSQEEKHKIAEAAAEAAQPFSFDDTMVTPATKIEFGDYQCNAAMGLAKNVGMSPRECATKIVHGLRPFIENIMDEPEIAGPGFINLRFKKDYLEKSIERMARDGERLAVPLTR